MRIRPYAIPQGDEREGLRDYLPSSDCDRRDRGPRALMVGLLIAAFLIGFLSGVRL